MATPNPGKELTGHLALLANLRQQICLALAENKVLSTRDLADALNEDRDRVYRQCRRLDKEGVLLGSKGIRHKAFCINCKKVLTKETPPECEPKQEDQANQKHLVTTHTPKWFIDLVCEWELMPQTMQAPQPKAV